MSRRERRARQAARAERAPWTCPSCDATFRAGVDRCSDCGVALRPPPDPARRLAPDPALVRVASPDDGQALRAIEVCLDAAGIPRHVQTSPGLHGPLRSVHVREADAVLAAAIAEGALRDPSAAPDEIVAAAREGAAELSVLNRIAAGEGVTDDELRADGFAFGPDEPARFDAGDGPPGEGSDPAGQRLRRIALAVVAAAIAVAAVLFGHAEAAGADGPTFVGLALLGTATVVARRLFSVARRRDRAQSEAYWDAVEGEIDSQGAEQQARHSAAPAERTTGAARRRAGRA